MCIQIKGVASYCFHKFFLLYSPFCHSILLTLGPLYVHINLSSIWQNAQVPLLVPETQSLRILQIRRFCAVPFSSPAQTSAVNWSRGSGFQTELCGLELECHGKMFPLLFSVSLALLLSMSCLSQMSEQQFCTWAFLWKELNVAISCQK